MEHNFNQNGPGYSINLTVDISTDEQKRLVEALGRVVSSTLLLKDSALLNTCLNLIHMYSNELLSNMADYATVNNIDGLTPEVTEILDKFSNVNNFSISNGN